MTRNKLLSTLGQTQSAIDPWGDISFRQDGLRITFFCRQPYAGAWRVCVAGSVLATVDLPGPARLIQSVAEARRLNGLTGLPITIHAAKRRTTGIVVDGHLRRIGGES